MRINDQKLAIGIFGMLIVGFALTSYLSFSVTREYVLTGAETQTLPLISDNIYSDIKEDLIDPINVSSLMANDAFLINWIQDGEKDLNSIKNYLSLIKQKYGYTSTFFVSDITGNYYYSDGILKTISEQDVHDVWYFDFKDLNTSIDLDIDNDEAKQGLLTVFINHRLENVEGDFLGVTGVGLELTEIAENLSKDERLYNHKIYIIDWNGQIQIHSDSNLIENTNIRDIEGICDITDAILSSTKDVEVFEYQDAESKKMISVRYIPEFNWFLIVEKDENASLASAKRSLIQNLCVGLILAVMVSLAINQVMKKNNRLLEQRASMDDLTGLFNRHAFLEIMQKENAAMSRYNFLSALLMIDIDDFKSINDQYGHYNGDILLTEIVESIKKSLRSSDSMGRWGGDEFIAYLSHADPEAARQIASRIQESVKNVTLNIDGKKLNRTVSMGIAIMDSSNNDLDEIIQKADDALIKGKKEGKGKIVFSL